MDTEGPLGIVSGLVWNVRRQRYFPLSQADISPDESDSDTFQNFDASTSQSEDTPSRPEYSKYTDDRLKKILSRETGLSKYQYTLHSGSYNSIWPIDRIVHQGLSRVNGMCAFPGVLIMSGTDNTQNRSSMYELMHPEFSNMQINTSTLVKSNFKEVQSGEEIVSEKVDEQHVYRLHTKGLYSEFNVYKVGGDQSSTLTPVLHSNCNNRYFTCATYTPVNDLAVFGSSKSAVVLDTESQHYYKVYSQKSDVLKLKFTANGKVLLLGTRSGELLGRDIREKSAKTCVLGCKLSSSFNHFDLLQAETAVLASSVDGAVLLFDLRKKGIVKTIRSGNADRFTPFKTSFHERLGYMASLETDSILVWDIATSSRPHVLSTAPSIHDIEFSHSGHSLYSAGTVDMYRYSIPPSLPLPHYQ